MWRVALRGDRRDGRDSREGEKGMKHLRNSERRHPAHHAPVEKFNESVLVQVNVCTKNRWPVLACAAGHQCCREIWAAADFWRVGQYVIMPDHIHLFCAPGRQPMPNLKEWVEYWKAQIAARWPMSARSGTVSSVANEGMDGTEPVPPKNGNTNSRGATQTVPSFKLWQRDFWDTQMRSRAHYEEKLSYVRMNPVRKELVCAPEKWPYQGVIFPICWN